MKKILFILLASCVVLTAKAQRAEAFTFATSIGTGFALSEPGITPFIWQAAGYYTLSKRFFIGAGTGLSLYEKALLPLFATAKFAILKPKKFTPYLECGVGYSFAPDKNANGGFYLNPSVGMEYAMGEKKKLFFALGYELQKLERLKAQEHPFFTVQFAEKLNHNTLAFRIGYMF